MDEEELKINSDDILEDFKQYVESIKNGVRDFEADQCEDKNNPTFLNFVDSYIAWIGRYGCDYVDYHLYYTVILGNHYFAELLKLASKEIIEKEES